MPGHAEARAPIDVRRPLHLLAGQVPYGSPEERRVQHALRSDDRTRSALCGVRAVKQRGRDWTPRDPSSCSDCRSTASGAGAPDDQGQAQLLGVPGVGGVAAEQLGRPRQPVAHGVRVQVEPAGGRLDG